MFSGKETVRLVAFFGVGLLLTGCVSTGGLAPPFGPLATPRPGSHLPQPPASDLRIPANAVAAAPPEKAAEDVPLVPVPPLPLGRKEDNPRTPSAPSAAVPPPAPPPQAPPIIAPTPTPTSTETNPLRRLYQQAAEKYATIDSYIVRLTRREQVNGKTHPEEVLLFKFRKNPWSIYFKWLSNEGKGREVIYVRNQFENKIHTLLAAGDVPLMPAGKRMSLPVDSILVRNASRHPITEAGVGATIDRLGQILAAVERGDKGHGTVLYLGMQNRPEFPAAVEAIETVIPAETEPALPRGGRRMIFFDRDSHLPVLIVTRDDRGQEVEYYRYDRFQLSVHLDNDDFDPDKMWKK
jgi:hypothetical protein